MFILIINDKFYIIEEDFVVIDNSYFNYQSIVKSLIYVIFNIYFNIIYIILIISKYTFNLDKFY